MVSFLKARLRDGVVCWLILACSVPCFGAATDVRTAQGQSQSQVSQPQAHPRPAAPSVVSPSTQSTEQDNSRRIDALERDMALAKYFMAIVRDAAIALGGLATLGLVGFGYLSWRRESRLQENYRQERKFFEESQRQQRENYAQERKFYEMQAERRASQEAQLTAQQLEMGALGLTRFEAMLANQSKNIEAVGNVLNVIAKASKIRLDREEGHEQFEAMLKSLRTGAERRYLQARDEAERFKDVRAAQWPSFPLDRLQVAIGALRTYQSVDDFIKEEKEKSEKEAPRHAALLQCLGVLAYYAEHNYEAAIGYLTDSNRLFEEQDVEDQFKPAQAWARHFLGVLKKNWPLHIEVAGTSLREAQKLLAAAESYLSMEKGQFLTPLTHAEVLSYLPDERPEADEKTRRVVERLEELRKNNQADSIQLRLLPRAYLLRGNIAHMQGDRPGACKFFAQACEVAANYPYAWLSLAEATTNADAAKPYWTTGLSLLSKPPATEKPETHSRVLVFSWGILASRYLGYTDPLQAYGAAFDDIGSLLERDSKYSPLFFSPTTKNLVSFDVLSQHVTEHLSKGEAGGLS